MLENFKLQHVLVVPSRNQIEADGETISVQPKVMSVLVYLARNSDRVISANELMDELWKGRIVTASSVQKSINSLRKVLIPVFDGQDVIENFSKRGYQLLLTPTFLQAEPIAQQKRNKTSTEKVTWLFGAILILLVSYIAYWGSLAKIPERNKTHQSKFSIQRSVITAIGHQEYAVPNPDNQHLVYISSLREAEGGIKQQLLIRDSAGNDWQIASTLGHWHRLAWSPCGTMLAAIEQQPVEGAVVDFYEPDIALYTFHIFSLDLANKKLLEKHLFSQWQGQLNSLTWIDNQHFEFVAKQGALANFQRYHYYPNEHQLTTIETLAFAPLPYLTASYENTIAVASRHPNGASLSIIDENERLLTQLDIDYLPSEISWLPDGTGVMLFSAPLQRLALAYLNGEKVTVSLSTQKNKAVSNPAYSSDGRKLLYTELHLKDHIWQRTPQGIEHLLRTNQQHNYGALYRADGGGYIYVSVRSNQTQLWWVENNQERLVSRDTLTAPISSLQWVGEKHYLYQSGGSVYFNNLEDANEQLIYQTEMDNRAVFYQPDIKVLWLVKGTQHTRNIWRVNLDTGKQQQVTFGDIASIINHNQRLYFQYVNQDGLWVLSVETASARLIINEFVKNSKLLSATDTHIYAVNGGSCQESNILSYSLDSGRQSVALEVPEKQINTSSFHPQQGAIYTKCELLESNILSLE